MTEITKNQAKDICITLLGQVKNPSVRDINNAIDNALKIFSDLSSSERGYIYKCLEANFSVYSEKYKILDSDEEYTPWLKDRKKDIQWNFWNRYKSYLEKKIAPDTINKLDNLTDDILDRIANPSSSGLGDKKGMVVGQVQSGKTSNYIGLINKAADAGYKLIIVLAGMHDLLRSQTQIRIDEGFIGRTTKGGLRNFRNNNLVGVGIYKNDLIPHSLTSCEIDAVNGDFNRKVAVSIRVSIKGSDPVIAVVKKNGSILKNLITWLSMWGDKMPDGKVIIRNTPVLIIDDEADNASINISQTKFSGINGCIRALLSLFEQSSYVGYTATPFANIFIPILSEKSVKGLDLAIKDYEFKVGQDLFPKDFIINIPAPSNYIGPAKVFGLPPLTSSDSAEDPLPLIRMVTDYDFSNASGVKKQMQNLITDIKNESAITKSFVPNKHKKNDPLPEELPDSLKYAIRCFILSSAARRVRKQINVHNSMLIHVSRFNLWQDQIASLVDNELKFYQKQIEMKSGNLLKDLEDIWKKEFVLVTAQFIRDSHKYTDPGITSISWIDVESEIYPAISKMEVRAVHGDKKIEHLKYKNISPLNYFESEQKGVYLSVIAIGGDKLSRGLTLEGLTVSYYLRAAKMYDTLMQMGRWFGYRPGYPDLSRIFMSKELFEWYKHITIASDELRRDFDYMSLLNKTPKEFGLKVRTHPGVLKITAVNKFRYKKIMYLSYSGKLAQTYQFKIDKNNFQKNFNAVTDLISDLGKPVENTPNLFNPKQKFVWKGENNFNLLISFLSKYKIGEEVIDVNKIADYIIAQTKKGNLVNWTVAIINNSTASPENQFSFPGIADKVGLVDRTNISEEYNLYCVTKHNITDLRHELIDLSESEIKEAISKTKLDCEKEDGKDVPELPSRERIKGTRKSENGLLLIYPLNHNCQYFDDPIIKHKISRKPISDVPIIGVAISFPEIENDEKIEYAVNKQFNEQEFGYPDELDQNDIDEGTN
ncbi:MAG: endonuclease [Euryarchaeota archaeon HGW-Euryarchaeota-1]|nr:MAG: endonuclease [Euryarchaeota archaeon HGW-Euryarchaeota-1]